MLTLSELFEAFIKQTEHLERKSAATIKNYRDCFELLIAFKPDLKLSDISPNLMVDFFTHLDKRERKVGNKLVVRKLKPSSVATIRAKLSAFFEWLVKQEHLSKNPFEDIKHPFVAYTKREAFTNEEWDIIFLAVSRDIVWPSPFLKVRNVTMVVFLALTGVRREELVGIELTDLDLNNKILTVRGEISKSRVTHYVPIDEVLLTNLKEYLELRKDFTTPYLWVSSNGDRPFTEHGAKHFVNRLNAATGINCHLHRFRHTFAVNHYLANQDLLALKTIMAHKDIGTTTDVYLRWLPNINAQAQINALRSELNKNNRRFYKNGA